MTYNICRCRRKSRCNHINSITIFIS